MFQQVKEYLMTGMPLDVYSAYRYFGTVRLPTYVSRLRKRGYRIERDDPAPGVTGYRMLPGW